MKRFYFPCLCGLLALSLTACAMLQPQGTPSTTQKTSSTATSSTTGTEETTLEGSAGTSSATESGKAEQINTQSSKTTPPTSKRTSKVTKSTNQEVTNTSTTVVTTSPAIANYADEVLRLVNVERAAQGLAPLAKGDAASQRAAAVRAEEIAVSFSHTRPDGRGFYTALYEAGVQYRGAGENIAYGYRTPAAVVRGWMNSEGHRKNILSITYTHLAVCFNDYNWVQLFYVAI